MWAADRTIGGRWNKNNTKRLRCKAKLIATHLLLFHVHETRTTDYNILYERLVVTASEGGLPCPGLDGSPLNGINKCELIKQWGPYLNKILLGLIFNFIPFV